MTVKAAPEDIERAKTLKSMKWSNVRIAESMGVHEKTVRRWLVRADDPEISDELSAARLKNQKRYIDDAWEILFKSNEIVKQGLKEVEVKKAVDLKSIATTMGIYMDKINIIETTGKGRGGDKPSININILPPDGHTTRIERDTVQIYDEPESLQCDDSGSREREDFLRLPESCSNSPEVSGEPWDDSCIDIQEPE